MSRPMDDSGGTPQGERGAEAASALPSALYRKKPVVIEARQWHKMGDHPEVRQHTLSEWQRAHPECLSPTCHGCGMAGSPEEWSAVHGVIGTLESDGQVVCPGDWIIKGVKGEFYPCKPDIFAATYEPALSPAGEQMSNDDRCPTPRVDALIAECSTRFSQAYSTGKYIELARTLERELAEAKHNAEDYEAIIGKKSYQEVADEIRELNLGISVLAASVNEWIAANSPGGWIDDLRQRSPAGGRDEARKPEWTVETLMNPQSHNDPQPAIPVANCSDAWWYLWARQQCIQIYIEHPTTKEVLACRINTPHLLALLYPGGRGWIAVTPGHLRELSGRLMSMCDQFGHPDWTAAEFLLAVRDVAGRLNEIAEALPASPCAPDK